MKKQTKIIILLLISLHVFAQAYNQTKTQFKKQLKEEIKNIRNDKYANVFAFDQYCNSIPIDVLDELEAIEKDSTPKVRYFIIQLLNICGKNGTDNIKKSVVNKLATSCKDKDPTNRSTAALYLKKYNKQDFSDEAKQQFSNLLELDHTYYKHIVQIVGYLDMKEEVEELQALLSDTAHNDIQIKWMVHTSLARLGVEESIDYCVAYAKSKDMNDMLVRYVLKDLAYIKQPEAVGYLVSELFSNEKNCRAANPNSKGKITCAYRIMEILAAIIKDYPYKIKYGTQLEAPSYDKALKDIRQWFKDNPDYVIVKDNF